MGYLWRDLPVLEALEAMIADNLAFIVPLRFGYHHLIPCGGNLTIYACDEKTLFGLIRIGGILHDIHHRLQVCFAVLGIGGLFWIFRIVDSVVEPAPHIP